MALPASVRNPPRLRLADPQTEQEARRATWLELFTDLVFVVAVAELANLLAERVSGGRMLAYAGLFVPIWWAWVGHTFYANRFDSDDIVHRLLTLAQVLGVAVLSATISDALGLRSAIFALAYAAVRVVLVLEYLRAAVHVPVARPLIRHYATGFTLALSLWIASTAVEEPARHWIWVVAMVIDIGTALTARRYQALLPPQPHHLPERFGLFVVIVLGESIASIVGALSASKVTGMRLASGAAGVVLAFGIWWLYFENLEESVVLRTRVAGQVWVYSHLLLLIAAAAVGVGSEVAILHTPVRPGERWLAAGSVAGTLGVLAVLHLYSNRPRRAMPRLIGAAACLAVPATIASVESTVVLGALALIVVAQVSIELAGRSGEPA